MTLKQKNILTCLVITLIIIFIYIPVRTGLLEKQFVKSIIRSTEKIVISLSSYENDKKLREKDLPRFFTIVKDKFPIAFIAVADKKNTILKAGKNENFIKSASAFDAIIESFKKDEFKIINKSDFVIKYYDQNRFYIFPISLTDGKILIVYPYLLSLKLIIQLILEILLISVFSILITALIVAGKNKKKTDKEPFSKKVIQKKTEKEDKKKNKKLEEDKDISPVYENQDESSRVLFEDKKINIKDTDKSKIDFESLNNYVYELFSYISKEYKTENASLYLMNEDSSRMNKIFELKGKAFLKISNAEFNSINMNPEIIAELKNSSVMLLEKGRRVTIPVIYRNALLGMINISRDTEFKGPEINDINERIKKIAKNLSEHILLSEIFVE